MASETTKRGRPRSFDRDAALDRAMELFWRRGYEGTSYDALTAAMGISASSLRNAFGSKEELFHEVARRYAEGPTSWFTSALTADTDTYTAIATLVANAVDTFSGAYGPRGCLVTQGGAKLAPGLESVAEYTTHIRETARGAIVERLQRGRDLGELPADADVETLGAFYDAVMRGIAVQANDGVDRATLEAIGAYALSTWPGRRLPLAAVPTDGT